MSSDGSTFAFAEPMPSQEPADQLREPLARFFDRAGDGGPVGSAPRRERGAGRRQGANSWGGPLVGRRRIVVEWPGKGRGTTREMSPRLVDECNDLCGCTHGPATDPVRSRGQRRRPRQEGPCFSGPARPGTNAVRRSTAPRASAGAASIGSRSRRTVGVGRRAGPRGLKEPGPLGRGRDAIDTYKCLFNFFINIRSYAVVAIRP